MAARVLAALVAGYALSPIDLIPDFIPVLGLVDDIIILPAGIWLVLRLIPPGLMADFRMQANAIVDRPRSTVAAVIIAVAWASAAIAAGWALYSARSI
ncbi:YkvA family protein [Qipengyuania zhejiangensis]|uniref:YkvA family protein n=1 Tax=Qipengyuania zhejiangensis TaxID=3077782 RepID=UPI003EBFE357